MDFVLWNEGTFSEKLFSGICFWIRWIAEKVWSGYRAAEVEAEEDEKSVRAFHQNAERLLDTYGNTVLRMAYSYLHNMSDAEEILQETEDLSFLWEAVKQLPEANREVIHLFYYEGYPTAQIAKILNRRESTVRSDLRRGRERLKKILKEEYDFE